MLTFAFAGGARVWRCALLRCAIGLLACSAPPVAVYGAPSDQATGPLRDLVTAGQLAELRWPNFVDYRTDVQTFYEASGFEGAWSRDSKPTPQALAIIDVLQQAQEKGLNPEDYDASRWAARLQQLTQPGATARFDLALTVCLMRYVSDLHLGRVNPAQVKFAIAARNSSYDLAQFLRQNLVTGQDVKSELNAVEPHFQGYQRTLAALHRYLELAHQDAGAPLPVPPKTLEEGSHYTGVPRLAGLLRLLGDLPADAAMPTDDLYQSPLVDAVKRFQDRHGLTADGRLGAQTVKQLNTPMAARVEQLRLTLERWRWLPQEFPQPPVVVNIPEFRLRALDESGKIVLTMNVIVGKALRHETPVFDKDMQYLVFRPYWNVPRSIQRSEIVPAIQRDRNYIARKNYEVTTLAGQLVTSGVISDEVLEQLRAGKLAVRQKPGATNALGLVKLIFPNEYNVYLHSTPSQQLFSQSRRDFSHGCIRVEKPDELAAWALQGKPEWTLEKVRTAMQEGKDNVQVNLAKPIPVLILYGTAVTDETGSVHFYDDIYGHDAELKKALAKGYPYHR
jgi:murein L,D-transpeptidase YcbB/YkuD